MSFRAKRELVQAGPRYRAGRHGRRLTILDEFVAVTGYSSAATICHGTEGVVRLLVWEFRAVRKPEIVPIAVLAAGTRPCQMGASS